MRLSVWKDRPGRTRVMALLGNGEHMDARRYYYKLYYPNEDINNMRILQLDMDPFNFNEDNLVALTVSQMNRLLNNHLLSSNPSLNLQAIQVLRFEDELKIAMQNCDKKN
ncbi:MAG: hypothetical protein IKB64_09810 [Paludibacteraceae bacterium]|nr:hypothetical protein [Paludibacteraceae bacterium]